MRCCAAKQCMERGDYKAHVSPRDMETYVYFCLKHIREHHAVWNYYAHMSTAEIYQENEADVTWRRPSFPFGAHRTPMTEKLKQAFQRFMDDEAKEQSAEHYPQAIKKAATILHLTFPFSYTQLKKKYHHLAKQYHPDVNPSNDAAELFKKITEAYNALNVFLESIERRAYDKE